MTNTEHLKFNISEWVKSYEIFQKPDLKKAHEVLTRSGLTLDAINADTCVWLLNRVLQLIDDLPELERIQTENGDWPLTKEAVTTDNKDFKP